MQWTTIASGSPNDLRLLRQFQRPQEDRLVQLQMVDVHQELFGDVPGGTLDLHLVDELLDHAPFLHARRLAAKLDHQLDLDQFIDGDAREIDVDDAGPPGVPLHLADKGRFGDGPGQIDQPAAVPYGRLEAFRGDGQGDRPRPCPYKMAGMPPERRSRRLLCFPRVSRAAT